MHFRPWTGKDAERRKAGISVAKNWLDAAAIQILESPSCAAALMNCGLVKLRKAGGDWEEELLFWHPAYAHQAWPTSSRITTSFRKAAAFLSPSPPLIRLSSCSMLSVPS
jgi:hypothetical protein